MKPRKPIKPVEPLKRIIDRAELHRLTPGDSPICFADYPVSAKAEMVEYYYDYEYGSSYEVSIFVENEIDNPHYEKEYAKYEKAMAKYERDLAAWEAWTALPPEKLKDQIKELEKVSRGS